MEGHCLTGQSPEWAVVPMEEDEEVHETLTICKGYTRRTADSETKACEVKTLMLKNMCICVFFFFATMSVFLLESVTVF